MEGVKENEGIGNSHDQEFRFLVFFFLTARHFVYRNSVWKHHRRKKYYQLLVGNEAIRAHP